ncbi:MAG: efflux RND transporter periplasmic adaptor subunit [Firmicutes bacterium]|nr:efflux RND transporter periplasmic adaptor subunit [Bacillota bacterium]
MHRKGMVIGALVVCSFLFGTGVLYRVLHNRAKTVAGQKKIQAMERVAVVTRPVTYGDVASVVRLVGTVKPAVEVAVVPKFAGRVVRVLAEVGDFVKVGQPLVELDQTDLRAQLKQAEAGLAAARARLAQVKAGARPEETEQAEAALAQAKASFLGAQRALENARRMYQERTSTAQALSSAKTQVEVTKAQWEAAQAQVNQTAANLKAATDNLQRMTELFAKGAATKAQLEAAQTQLEIAKAQYQSAQALQEQARAALEGAQALLAITQETHDNQTALKAQVDAAESQYQIAEANLKAAQARVAQIKAGARREDVEAAEAQVHQAEAAVELARAQLTNAVITAPIGGVVAARAIDPGEMASPGVPVFTLVAIDRVFVDVSLTESLVGKVQNGTPVEVSVDAFPGLTFRGVLTNLAPAADPRTREFSARVSIPNRDHRLKAGMSATVKLATEVHRHVLVLPADALVDRNGDRFVFVVTNGRAKERLVKTGLSDGVMTEILAGLAVGEKGVGKGQDELADGIAVAE